MSESIESTPVPLTSRFQRSEVDLGRHSRVVRFGELVTKLYLSPALCSPFDEVFGHLHTTEQISAVMLEAILDGRFVHVWRDDSFAWSCMRDEFIPLIKAEATELALQYCVYEIALHAGAYVRSGSVTLLLGSPGAGKTTLGLALLASGFDLFADDVVLLHKNGHVSGLAFAPAVKSGAWDLVRPYWSGVVRAQTHTRPDGQKVRYAPAPSAEADLLPVSSIAILDRRDGARAGFEPIDPVDVLGMLLAEATSANERLTVAGFSALVDALENIRCVTLTYCDLTEAAQTLREFCR